ncbi:hypothetical protein [Neolewinella litorea]|uniref:Uncharacterized protein n=1 Tax=Neolewinella litorea TaxID=2562452 RepID=A0A4S4N7L7_9BACT|nr:hypothetical protein [Neolewinella litorea]THH34535.1 hypothetical protein E4021_17705 [Neolewinella litorea]
MSKKDKKEHSPISNFPTEELSSSPLSIGFLRRVETKEERKLVKHSNHLLNSKTSSDRYDQEKQGALSLFEGLPQERQGELLEAKVTFVGVSLQPNEDRLLTAVLRLLSDTEYQGNQKPRRDRYSEGGRKESYPVLEVTPHALFSAYVAKEDYSGKEQQNALKALGELLDKKFYWSYSRKEDNGSKSHVKHLGSLITDYKEVNREDGKKLLELTINPVLVDQIDTHYVLYPEDIANRTALFCPGKVLPAVNRLRDYLALQVVYQKQKESIEVKIGYEKLLYKLELDKYIKRRERKRAEEYFQRAIDTCKAAGAILSFEIKAGRTGEPTCCFEVSTSCEFW